MSDHPGDTPASVLKVVFNQRPLEFTYGKDYSKSKKNMLLTAAASLDLISIEPGADAPALDTLLGKTVVICVRGQCNYSTLEDLWRDMCSILSGDPDANDVIVEDNTIHVLKSMPGREIGAAKVQRTRKKAANSTTVCVQLQRDTRCIVTAAGSVVTVRHLAERLGATSISWLKH